MLEVRMKMNKSRISGWDKVFSFSLRQILKSKAYIIGTIIMTLVAIGGIVFSADESNMFAADSELMSTGVTKVYLFDETQLLGDDLKDDLSAINENYKEELEITKLDVNPDKVRDVFSEKEDRNASILIHFYQGEESYILDVVRSEESGINDMHAGIFGEEMQQAVYNSICKSVGITEEQLEFISSEVATKAMVMEGNSVDDSEVKDGFLMTSTIGMVIFMMMVFILAIAGENASSSMVVEKGTRVIEYVLTSVRPMAIIVGKVMSVIASQLIQIGLMLFGGAAALFVMREISGDDSGVKEIANNYGMGAIVDNFSASRFIIALLILVGGIVFYVTLAALIGSTASKMEELTQTQMVYSFILIIGAYSSMVLSMVNLGENNFAQNFLLAFPLSSPFVTPMYLLMGDCSVMIGIISVVVMVVAILLVVLLVSKVFETVIMYNGSKVSFKMLMEFAGLRGKKNE